MQQIRTDNRNCFEVLYTDKSDLIKTMMSKLRGAIDHVQWSSVCLLRIPLLEIVSLPVLPRFFENTS